MRKPFNQKAKNANTFSLGNMEHTALNNIHIVQ